MEYHSHVGQDRWVAEVYRAQKGGFFLDFGAFDGVTTSNTYFLERALSWQGICVEPNPRYYGDCCSNRKCVTINNALWSESRKSVSMYDAHGLSRLTDIDDDPSLLDVRRSVTLGTFTIDTINPMELLDRFNAPTNIHYLSMDLEGAELAVLEAFDFYRYHFGLVSIEINGAQEKRDAIRHIMAHHNYGCSELRNDDLFYNVAVIHGLSGGNCEHPEHVRDRVLNSYAITSKIGD